MSNILDELTIKFDRYQKYTQKEQQNDLIKMANRLNDLRKAIH